MGYYGAKQHLEFSINAKVTIRKKLNTKSNSDLEIDIKINKILKWLKLVFSTKIDY